MTLFLTRKPDSVFSKSKPRFQQSAQFWRYIKLHHVPNHTFTNPSTEKWPVYCGHKKMTTLLTDDEAYCTVVRQHYFAAKRHEFPTAVNRKKTYTQSHIF